MIRAACFNFNPQTAVSNSFQQQNSGEDTQVSARAIAEFDAFAEVLRSADISVTVLQDSASPVKPDAVFPNNWFSSHADGTLVLYLCSLKTAG